MSRAAAGPEFVSRLPLAGEAAPGYWELSQRPWPSLLLILPLVILYEAGTRFLVTGAARGAGQQIIAFELMQRFFAFFGVTVGHLPALAVVVILLAWHIARNDRWSFPKPLLLGMALEGAALIVPLLGLGLLLSHYFPLAATRGRALDYLVLSAGAGVYEELVFRLIVFTYLNIILRDAFGLQASSAGLLIVLLSALLFSAYHYLSPYESFKLKSFIFRSLAGGYFGVLFLTRGFGITAFSHSIYDMTVVLLTAGVTSRRKNYFLPNPRSAPIMPGPSCSRRANEARRQAAE